MFVIKKEHLCRDFLILKKEIKKNNSISVHVRRGDYVKLNHSCSVSYYNNAIKFMESKNENQNFIVFSDDIEWCKKNLIIKNKCTFIDERFKLKDYHELILMKFCKHNIISNSTFSWWGAFLNYNKDGNQKVIYPEKWFGNKLKHLNTNDLFPERWINISE